MTGKKAQRWDLTVHGQHHRVEVRGSVYRTIRWYVNDDLVATKKSADDNVSLEADLGHALGLKFSVLGHAKRVTLLEGNDNEPAKARAALGTAGIDLDPEPGSTAALREQRIREHPLRHATIAMAGGVAKVVVPLLLGLLVVRFAINLPWPTWDIPWPDIDLPRVRWPDLPWPEITLPDWQVPEWVRWVAEKLKFVWPILLALTLAKSEINRRRKQDALKAQRNGSPGTDLHRHRPAAMAPAVICLCVTVAKPDRSMFVKATRLCGSGIRARRCCRSVRLPS